MALYRSPEYQTFRVNWPFGSGEFENIFSRWRLWQQSLILVLIFVFQTNLILQEKKFKIDLQDDSHLGALVEMLLPVYDLQVARYFLPSF